MSVNNLIVLTVTIFTLLFLFNKRIRNSETWRAIVTPLASIIGSGFLISAPLLILGTGQYATLAMLVIVIIGYALGSSIRFNIKYFEPSLSELNSKTIAVKRIENISKITLAGAYLVSITFYLKLLAAFFMKGVGISSLFYQNLLSTILLLFIGFIGKRKGLHILESLEVYSVNTKLSIIVALILGHAVFNFSLMLNGGWELNIYPHEGYELAIKKILGMLVIIQGFETSRYLGNKYKPELRIRTMKMAQIISGVVYVTFIATTLTAFNGVHLMNETTVVDICRKIAPALPSLLIIAAVMSQFSAAVADTVGGGGLLAESFKNHVSLNTSYLIITLTAVLITWLTNIYSIITYASKAFAIYYLLQLIISMRLISEKKYSVKNTFRIILFLLLSILMILVLVFGIPVKD
jgi:hypothetical protein